MTAHTQIAVIGGGLVGKAAAVASARAGFKTVHIAPAAPEDRRTSALMQPSVDYMRAAGLLDDPDASGVPLRRIRIIDATERMLRAPETMFDARETGVDAFGWNFANTELNARFAASGDALADLSTRQASLSTASRDGALWSLELDDGTRLTADLVVGADGKKSRVRELAGIGVREKVYRQSALVCDLDLGRALDGESVEFHYPNGPFTLVPAGGTKANLVWIDLPDTLEAARADIETLKRALLDKSQHLFGALNPLSASFIFPLSSLSVERAGKDGAVLVGEAAHAFPPIGAQGLNLGLRDVANLDRCLSAANPAAWGWADGVARSYAAGRKDDLTRTGLFVDGLFTSLLSPHLPAQALRTAGLWSLNAIPALRRRAMAFGLGQ
ncbi:FAD-dependent monooxygenase [Pelagibacterium luteolum]|uniref:2-octaprenyl-6-methoxyphenol hydroxylase n=1 Tax=Pelagibacterium luteolum TaxID=440168 RepID=A0A1G7VWS9_9HYPH|nr:FAD-dependent monooxygenase [Pelagibacterium luteolum]SDG64193.1 2-octaprenyl-6-methoxyphenol hydroxylase [Pelagibacterium luteolum]